MIEVLIRRDRVEAALRAKQQPQEWLAEQIGFTPQALSKALKKGSLSLANAKGMAMALDTGLDWLLGVEAPPTRIGQAVRSLPPEEQQLVLDFLLYRIKRQPLEPDVDYAGMIQKLIDGLSQQDEDHPTPA